jgi:hypothetical protein
MPETGKGEKLMSWAEDEGFDMYELEDFSRSEYKNARERYELLDTSYIINRLIQYGERANDVTEFFPAYDVAVKLRKSGYKATEKQHNAMAHCLAYIDILW